MLKRGIYLYDFICQAIEIMASIQYLDISSLWELPSAEVSLDQGETPFQGRLHLTMDWCGQWGREDEAIIPWPPHPKLGQLWRTILILVLAMFYLKPLYLSSPSVQSCFIFFPQWCRPWEHSLINVLHTNLLLRDCIPGKLICNSDN